MISLLINIKRFAVALADIQIYFTHSCVRLIGKGSNNIPYFSRMFLWTQRLGTCRYWYPFDDLYNTHSWWTLHPHRKFQHNPSSRSREKGRARAYVQMYPTTAQWDRSRNYTTFIALCLSFASFICRTCHNCLNDTCYLPLSVGGSQPFLLHLGSLLSSRRCSQTGKSI